MANQPEAASSTAPTSIGGLNQIVKDYGALIASVIGVAGAFAAFWDESPLWQRLAVFGTVGLITAFAVYAQVIAPWIERRRRQRVIALVETDKPLKPATFRLRPYEESDHDSYSRPDGAHEKAVAWLEKAEAPFLYLTGFSGTGKSSLLQAWLIPELAVAERPVRTIVVRSFADPIRQLVEALKAEGALPVELPAEETEPLALLGRAAEVMQARHGRLLIAIDQFEECLILQDQGTKDRLAELFAELQKNPVGGLQFLFVMRTDYLKFDELTALNLPDPRPRENWFNLEALSHADARTILRQALPNMDPGLENQVIEEASDVDDLPGLIRPITLNMMGLILRNFAGAALTKTAPGRLIQDFLRRAIEKPGIEQAAPKLLAEMITDKGTKKPMAEAALASAAGIEPAMTRKTLYLLGEEGVVRELDRIRNIWEISHDFVARQIGQIIPRLRPSWWRQAQKAATPVALVAWLVILGAGWPIYQVWESARIADDLRALGVRVHGEKGAYDITIDRRTNARAIDLIFAYLEKFDPVRLEILNNHQLQALPSLDALGALTSLSISNNGQLQALPPLDALASLSISFNHQLQALPPLDALGALTSLSISGNAQLQALPPLDALGALTSLRISFNAQLQALPPLDALGALTSLRISNNHLLQALPPLDALGALTSLRISNNHQLQALPSLDALGALASLSISGNAQLQALPSLDALGALASLSISGNAQLQALPSLAERTNLKLVRIGGNGKIDGLPELGDVDRLDVVGFFADDIDATIEALKGLPKTITIETSRDDVHDFSERLNQAREELGLPPAKVAPWGIVQLE